MPETLRDQQEITLRDVEIASLRAEVERLQIYAAQGDSALATMKILHETRIKEAEAGAGRPEKVLTFDRFQEANVVRCREAFRHNLPDWSLLEWAGAAAGEMGEAANICKKLRRQAAGVGGAWAARDPEKDELLKNLADEIGDTLAYLSLLASAAGLNLGRCAADKFDCVSAKAGWVGAALAAEPAEEIRPEVEAEEFCGEHKAKP